MEIKVALHFPKGYIAHPYWPERNRVIEILKVSKASVAKSDEKKAKCLKAYFEKEGMTDAEFRDLEARAAREFWVAGDVGLAGADPAEIIVPPDQLNGMMAHAASECPAAVRIAPNDQIRTVADWGPLRTGRAKADGVWGRFVDPKDAKGHRISNQKRYTENQFLRDVTAEGTLTIFSDAKDADNDARSFFAWAGSNVGCGACRKMGWGRFTITRWEKA